jgi:hypothetical protein
VLVGDTSFLIDEVDNPDYTVLWDGTQSWNQSNGLRKVTRAEVPDLNEVFLSQILVFNLGVLAESTVLR